MIWTINDYEFLESFYPLNFELSTTTNYAKTYCNVIRVIRVIRVISSSLLEVDKLIVAINHS